MGKEYSRDATEHGQIMIAEAIRSLGNSGGGESSIIVDTEITENSTNPVTSSAIYEALQNTKSPEIRVNVIQSEHQLIYWNFFHYNEFGMMNSDIDTSDPTQYSQQYGNLVSSVAKCGQIFEIGILPDNGYNRGDFVIRIDDKLLVEGQDYSVSGNEVHSLGVPLGSTLNLSATPATPV